MRRRDFIYSCGMLALSGCVSGTLRQMGIEPSGFLPESNSPEKQALRLFETFRAAHPLRMVLQDIQNTPTVWDDTLMLQYARRIAPWGKISSGLSGDDLGIVVPPHAKVGIQMDGLCYDPGRVPPVGGGEPAQLLPIQTISIPELEGLEHEVLRYHARTRTTPNQITVIFLRNLHKMPYSTVEACVYSQHQALTKIRPDAPEIILRAKRQIDARPRMEQGRTQNSILGEFEKLLQLFDISAWEEAFERQVLQAKQAPGKLGKYPKSASYSMLAPGVAAQTVLYTFRADIMIVNATDQPFRFEPTSWIAVSPDQNVQRVVFCQWDEAGLALEEDESLRTPEALKDIGKILGEKSLGIADTKLGQQLGEKIGRLNGKWLQAIYPYAKEALLVTPVIGNLLSLYEAFDEDASLPERALNLIGAVPGYGSLLHLTKSSKALGKLAAKALDAVPNLAKLSDRTEWLRTLNDIGNISLDTEGNKNLWTASMSLAEKIVQAIG